jgi:site-specific DNA-adenine methylase
LILQYLPVGTTRLVEPFCGSAALSIATATRGRAKEFWLNDFNAPLAKLLSLIVNNPKELGKFYRELWRPIMRMRWSIIIRCASRSTARRIRSCCCICWRVA